MIDKVKKIIPIKLGHSVKKALLFIRGMYYKGNNYYCPICGGYFRKFLPGGFDLPVIKEMQITGAGYRQNNVCPRCLSTDRDRLVYLYLKERTDFFSVLLKVLHIAPEPSLYKIFKKLDNIEYIAGTKYQEGFYYSEKLIKLDITSLPFNNDYFDLIIANHILEHIEDDRLAMKELYRVLKIGGQAILQVPISLKLNKTYENPTVKSKTEREKHFGQFDHIRLYGKDYPKRLEEVGFQVEKLKPGTEKWPLNEITKYGLNKNEYLYVAHKVKAI